MLTPTAASGPSTSASTGGRFSTERLRIALGSVTIALHGFVQGSSNVITFSGDGTHSAPDLDWIEVLAGAGGANDPNLVGYWNFDEAQGSIIRDASGTASDGSLHSSTAWITSSLAPQLQFANTSALGFNGYGSNSYVEVGTKALPATNAPQSIAAWINLKSLSGQPYIVSMWDSSSSSGVSLGINNGQLQTWAWGPRTLVSTAPPSLNVWHHVAYTFDGTTHKLYLDGTLVNSSTVPPNAHAVTRAQLGAYDGGSSFNGQLDEIRIYKAALTATQVANLSKGYESDQGASAY